MKRKIFSLLAAFVLVLAVGSVAKADFPTQDGISYSLTFVEADSANVYDVLLTIDTSESSFAGNLYSWSVQFTGATGVTIESQGAGEGSWSVPISGPTNANGCSDNPGNHWCSQNDSGVAVGAAIEPGANSYTWLLDVTMADGVALPTDSHIQAFYCLHGSSPNGTACNGYSQDGTLGGNPPPVPEPGSLALFGTGLLSIAGFLRRKMSA